MSLASKSETRDFNAARAMQKLYGDLEALLKRHQPLDYAQFAAAQLAAAFERPTLLAQIRPHDVLHSIEANCAFSRGQNRDPVDRDRIARVMNVYYNHVDPLQSGLLDEENLHHFFLAAYRQQIDVQQSPSQEELVRNLQLFVSENPMPKLASEFQGKYGLSFDAWVKLCFFATVAATKSESRTFHRTVLAECEFHTIPNDQVDAFLKLTNLTPRQIGERFRHMRENAKPQFHSLIRSVFLQHPLIGFERDMYVAPHPRLMLRHSGQGLYNKVKELPSFGEEFGASVQRHVGTLLNSASRPLRVFCDGELEAMTPGKSCDFLVEFDECVVLVESKAASFVAERLVETAIRNDGSTTKIVGGVEQLYTTAFDLRSGVFNSLGIDSTKPVVGIVATFGDIPFVNSDWYRDNFIVKRAESKLKPPMYPSANMHRWPLVLSLGTLELLLTTLNSFDVTVTALCDEKASVPYIKTGDWDQFLKAKLASDESAVRQLPFVVQQWNTFGSSIGIPKRAAQQ